MNTPANLSIFSWLTRCMLLTLLISLHSQAQMLPDGHFYASNDYGPTRIGSADGPYAGAGIYGQFFAGQTVNSLMPVGVPVEHVRGLVIPIQLVVVPGVPCGTRVQVQMIAWDARVWGTDWTQVPENQFGRTDISHVDLSCYDFPIQSPAFFTSAIVPPVPEPSTWLLIAISAFWVRRLRTGRRRKLAIQ